MIRFLIALALVLCVVQVNHAQSVADVYGIQLNPGETLISVNGVAVCNSVVVDRPIARVATAPIRAVGHAVRAVANPSVLVYPGSEVLVYPMQQRCINGNCR